MPVRATFLILVLWFSIWPIYVRNLEPEFLEMVLVTYKVAVTACQAFAEFRGVLGHSLTIICLKLEPLFTLRLEGINTYLTKFICFMIAISHCPQASILLTC